MDWTAIITTLIATLIPTGGFLGLFTIRERKTELMLNNASTLNDGWTMLANERQEMVKERDAKIAEKDIKIDELYRMNSSLRHRLDDAHTRAAVAEVMRCDISSCPERRPPFGSHMHLPACKGCKEEEVIDITLEEEHGYDK